MVLLPTPPFNILALAMHWSSLYFLLNNCSISSLLFPGFCIYCRVISLSAVIGVVQQNLNQLHFYGFKTEPISIYCCPTDSSLPHCRHDETPPAPACAQKYLLDVVTHCSLCSSSALQHLPLLTLAPFSVFTRGQALRQAGRGDITAPLSFS